VTEPRAGDPEERAGDDAPARENGGLDVGGAEDERAEDERAKDESGANRRDFLRRAAGEVAAGAGRIYRLSNVAQRSAAAAGAALVDGLGLGVVEPPSAAAARDAESGPPPAPVEQPAGAAPLPAASAPVPAAPPSALAAEQDAFLAARGSATIAVLDVHGEPQLTAGPYHWDGAVFRLPTGAFTAKAANVDRDARVSLLIGDLETGWVAVAGHAALVVGPAAREHALIVQQGLGAAALARAWSSQDDPNDLAVIVVTPTRFVWRLA